MEKSAYLDAMGVTRWRSADAKGKPYLIIYDSEADNNGADISLHPLVTEVLSLLNIALADCDFDTEMVKGMQVVWDMRKLKVRPRVAWLVSSPLDELQQGHQAKRELWQQIYQHLSKAA
ncbi:MULTISPECIES: DNA polymerase III subunit psi [unclassified Shewanella]|uniref:DNA polymerase III subunit psi n=1 Tax=unclassified Shewanella TaxID=196818 RepID=UPI0006D659B4|nr:DNA polymerase III subunit psi [Shewanella sp. P1-14-1]KPZ68756.1 hypothetical protein AN944_03381 [Shewanella sp. P1-14-1]